MALSYLGEILEDSNRYASAQTLTDFAQEQNLELELELSDLERALNDLFINEVLERERAGAERGEVEAQMALAERYATGRGVAMDLEQAAQWYRRAAEQGDSESQYRLALLYDYGAGVSADSAQAVAWLRKAAEQGESRAFRILGAFYAKGEVVDRDVVQSYMWFNISALRGDLVAQKFREIIAITMTPAEIILAEKMARAWLRKYPGS